MSHDSTRFTGLLAFSLAAGLSAAVLAAPRQDAKPPATAPVGDLPEAAKIIEDAIDAMGGRKAFDAAKSVRLNSTMSMMGMEMTAKLFAAKPDKLYALQNTPGGEVVTCINGDVAWIEPPGTQPTQLLEPHQLLEMHDRANIYAIVPSLEQRYGSFQTVGRTEFNGQDCFKVELKERKRRRPAEPNTRDFAYFNVETSLIAGMQQVMPVPAGKPEVAINFLYDEYKEFGDLKLFTAITIDQAGRKILNTIHEIVFNDVDMARFAIPDEVKALVAAREKQAEEEAEKETEPAAPPKAAEEDPELAQFPEAKRKQIKKQIEAFLKNEDPNHLRMVKGILEGQLGSVPEADKAQLQYIIKKLDERIAELEGGG